MDETRSARRAAFEGILEAGGTPLLFENMVYPNGESELGAGGQTAALRQMNAMIEGADYFLALYDSSIGQIDPNRISSAAIEYEFFRFMIQRKIQIDLREEGTYTLSEVRKRLQGFYWDESESPNTKDLMARTKRLESEIKRVREQISRHHSLKGYLLHNDNRHNSSSLGTSGLSPEQYDPATERLRRDLSGTLRKDSPYGGIFEDYVRVLVRDIRQDRPVSLALMRTLFSVPFQTYSVTEVKAEPPNVRPRFLPASVELHSKVAEWTRDLVERSESTGATSNMGGNREAELRVCVRGGPDVSGFLSRFTEILFEKSLNIYDIWIGESEHMPIIDSSVGFYVNSFTEYSSRDVRNLERHIEKQLSDWQSEYYSMVDGTTETALLVKVAFDSGGRAYAHSKSLATSSPSQSSQDSDFTLPRAPSPSRYTSHKFGLNTQQFVVQVFVADVPGMLHQVGECLRRNFAGDIRSLIVRGTPLSTPNHVTFVQCRHRREILASVHFSDKSPGNDRDYSEVSARICGELRYLVGVYDVRVGSQPIPSDPDKWHS